MYDPRDTDGNEDLPGRRLRLRQQGTASGPPQPSATADPGETPVEPQALTDADMPDLDSMDENSDYAPFLSPQVSDQLRARALRQLFRLPALGVCDGLDDYDDDFTQLPGLADAVTHEMQRMLVREVGRQGNGNDEAETGAAAPNEESTLSPEDEDRPPEDV